MGADFLLLFVELTIKINGLLLISCTSKQIHTLVYILTKNLSGVNNFSRPQSVVVTRLLKAASWVYR